MQITKNIYSNTDKFIAGNTTKFCYTGKLYDNDISNTDIMYFCYSETKPKKNKEENINKVKMLKTDIGMQVDILLEHIGPFYFSFEYGDKIDNNRGNWYKVKVEEMPLALFVLKQQALPQKISKFDYFKDQIKARLTQAFEAISKLKDINSYSSKKQKENN